MTDNKIFEFCEIHGEYHYYPTNFYATNPERFCIGKMCKHCINESENFTRDRFYAVKMFSERSMNPRYILNRGSLNLHCELTKGLFKFITRESAESFIKTNKVKLAKELSGELFSIEEFIMGVKNDK